MGAVVARGLGRRHWLGPALVLDLMVAGLVSGTLYHSSTLLFLAFGAALCLDLKPISEERRFDKDIHGLAILCAAVLLAQAVLVTRLMGPVPPANSLIVHLVQHVPMAMSWEEAGGALDRWAARWRQSDKKAAYELLDWSVRHSRRPEGSLRLEAAWFQADGFEAEARYTLGQAQAAAK
jgi:hypothetical protein